MHGKNLLTLDPVHFVGIGGIGMSGIADIMHAMGHRVQGSDVANGANIERLRAKGIPVSIGHRPENLDAARLVVVSSAVKGDNIELLAARRTALPIVHRSEMLAALMAGMRSIVVTGTHGKTTTTALLATVFEGGGFDPTVINGGIIRSYGSNVRLGSSEWIVVEGDESDGSFSTLPVECAVLTNVTPEHLDHYRDFANLRAAFSAFVRKVPADGMAVLCADHADVLSVASDNPGAPIVTYGENPDSDVRLANVQGREGGTSFQLSWRDGDEDLNFWIPVPGKHNARNATAATIIARRCGIAVQDIRRALKGFGGVERRFTFVGTWNGVRFFDDYAHHPTEIATILQVARDLCSGRLIAVVQPHRYSRVRNLFDEFCRCCFSADIVIVADIYSAGEAPVESVTRDALVAGMRAAGHPCVVDLPDCKDLPRLIASFSSPHDDVVCCGAGTITQWVRSLPCALEQCFPAGTGQGVDDATPR